MSFYATIFYMTSDKNFLRFMGIDYGTKRIGVAISDESRVLAFPKEIILNDSNTFKKIGDIIKNERVGEIVIGESVDFSGKLNVLSGRIEVFILELKERFKLPAHKQKEFLTSVEARRYKNSGKQVRKSNAYSKLKQIKSGRADAAAAALILQRYLDRMSRQNGGIK
jgi:putative holliday junction resolvase